jgi:hypothetical protein
MSVLPKMKSLLLTLTLLIGCAFDLKAEAFSISIIEQPGRRGGPKVVASIEAKDDATRKEIAALWDEAAKAFPEDRRNMYGPDSSYVSIVITRGNDKITINSWHPLFEKNPKLVVTSQGVESLDGRTREDVLKADKKWYQNARRCFDKIVAFTESKADPTGAGQPATKPAGKVPAEVQPPTPTSKDASR